jgi:mannose-6-phosphate isomerase-like protein (cupin superfamily)
MVLRPSAANEHGMALVVNNGLGIEQEDCPRERGRWIYPPDRAGWNDFALSEWVLEGAGAADRHVDHTETNIVVEGELHVECQGRTVIAQAGDAVTVPANHVGRYWAPVYARMYAIYGPSDTGEPPQDVHHWHL